VEAALLHVDERSGRLTRERLLLWGGIVGQNLPTLRPATLPVAPGDTIVFATDGVRSEFVDEVDLAASVGSIANRILAKHATGSDDALVLVARYRGGTA
jgi:hypothetical protein